jgi:hypothetical protein
VTIFNKRNALVGFLTLKAISRKRRRMLSGGRKRGSWKLPVLLGLGVISAGVLAVLLALMLRRQREPEHIEGYVVAGGPESFDATPLAEQQEPSRAA